MHAAWEDALKTLPRNHPFPGLPLWGSYRGTVRLSPLDCPDQITQASSAYTDMVYGLIINDLIKL